MTIGWDTEDDDAIRVPTPTDPGSAVATSGGESFTVSLPVTPHETPEDEAALAIDDVPVVPVYVDAAAPATRSITVIPTLTPTAAEQPESSPIIPALPESDDVTGRPTRLRGGLRALDAPVTPPAPRRGPSGLLQRALWQVTFHLVDVGDSWAVRQRTALEARIGRDFGAGIRTVPVIAAKGGIGTTTVAALLGMAFADVRHDGVIAIDAKPDRGTLADRITRTTSASARDVLSVASAVDADALRSLLSRDVTGLDVLASESGPLRAAQLNGDDLAAIVDVVCRYRELAVIDSGSGVISSSATAALHDADALVIVSGGSPDEARLTSEIITWLESHGRDDLVRNAVLAVNTATLGTNLDKLEEIEAHFAARVRDIVRIPYDPALATGSVIHFHELKPITRDAARDLAALVGDGIASEQDA